MRRSAVWLAALVGGVSGCGSGGGFPDAARQEDSAIPLGNFSLAWTITGSNGQPVTCAQVGALTVTVAAHDTISTDDFAEPFSCSGGAGISEKITPSTFDMSFLLGAGSNVLATGTKQTGVVVMSNATTALQTVMFTIDASGSLAIKLDSGKAGGNCAATGSGGAGITATALTMTRKSDGACEPIALQIGSDASRAGSAYTINCTTPQVVGCIENDQTISATGVPADTYVIRATGDVGSAACWGLGSGGGGSGAGDVVIVPPLSGSVSATLPLVYATGSGCP